MQVVRTVVWVVLLVALLAFSFFNWNPVEVQIWDNLVLETRIPALVIVSFLLGLLPMWLLHRGAKWRYARRISALEAAVRGNAAAVPLHEPARDPPPSEELSAESARPKPKDEILG